MASVLTATSINATGTGLSGGVLLSAANYAVETIFVQVGFIAGVFNYTFSLLTNSAPFFQQLFTGPTGGGFNLAPIMFTTPSGIILPRGQTIGWSVLISSGSGQQISIGICLYGQSLL